MLANIIIVMVTIASDEHIDTLLLNHFLSSFLHTLILHICDNNTLLSLASSPIVHYHEEGGEIIFALRYIALS